MLKALQAVFNGLRWLTARKWGRWLLIIMVSVFAFYSWNLYVSRPHAFYEALVQIKYWTKAVLGALVVYTIIWSCFAPRVPEDKVGIRIVAVPFFDQMKSGQVITPSLWYQGQHAHPIAPGTSILFPLIRFWMYLGWFKIQHQDLANIDPKAVGVLFSNIDGMPDKDQILYWGNGPEEYSGVILTAGRPREVVTRGIVQCVLPPGKHAIIMDTDSRLGSFKLILIDTSKNTIHLDDHPIPDDRAHHKFEPMSLKTKNGFPFRAKVEIVFRVKDMVRVQHAQTKKETRVAGPVLIVARNGSLRDYVRDVLVPITTAVINAAAVEIMIDELLDEMEAVQKKLQTELEEAAHKTLPLGQLESEIVFHQVSLVFDTKGFPATEEYVRARTTTAIQGALLVQKKAEIPVAEEDQKLQTARAQAQYASYDVLSKKKAENAKREAEAITLRGKAKADVLAEAASKGVSPLGQVVLAADDFLQGQLVSTEEKSRDEFEINQTKTNLAREQVVRSDAPPDRRRRRRRQQGAPTGGSEPTPADTTDETEDDQEEEQ